MFRTHDSQRTQFVSCSPKRRTISEAGVAGPILCPDAFMYTSHRGGFISLDKSCSAASNLAFAGSINAVWKPPDVLSSFACKHFAAVTFRCNNSTAAALPAQENPFGKKTLAIWHTSAPLSLLASSHNEESFSCVKPATESMLCADAEAASCMSSPRNFTNFNPASKVKTPATPKAVYSPSERPHTACTLSTHSGLSAFNFSTAAKPATNIAG
mmetsp:Transcript_27570/g.72674  ORF Transcript_27570/g.72674 Transcript_27570/m.72674 type:complete len:213 (-) Transcript_27570:868-1506(-)